MANVRVVPIDPIQIPARDDLPSIDVLVQQALANRSDLAAANILRELEVDIAIDLMGFTASSRPGVKSVSPSSSAVSRAAASLGYSPSSRLPPGSSQPSR